VKTRFSKSSLGRLAMSRQALQASPGAGLVLALGQGSPPSLKREGGGTSFFTKTRFCKQTSLFTAN